MVLKHVERIIMLLQIFGLATSPTWWHLNRIPTNGGKQLATVLADSLPGAGQLEFYIDSHQLHHYSAEMLQTLWSDGIGRLVAKPSQAKARHMPTSRLQLLTADGPDAGRMFPLTRQNLSVGRAESQAQIRDPWLSAHDFDIRMSSDGTVISPSNDAPLLWESGQPYTSGSTSFQLQRGRGLPLTAPKDPGAFEIDPGQPPSPPNVVLQVIGAAAPLVIGIVLMVMTGMWYFLLFSGISVIVATVMIGQYRRNRKRFIGQIEDALVATAAAFQRSIFTPHQLTGALTAEAADPLSLQTSQPAEPVIYIGTIERKARMEQVQKQRWDAYLSGSVAAILSLPAGKTTIIVGDHSSRRPVKNWCIAQMLRHHKATQTGLVIGNQLFGAYPTIVITDDVSSSPTDEQHSLVFTDYTSARADEDTTIIDLHAKTIDGVYEATQLDPVGIGAPTLTRIARELGLDQPADALSAFHLSLSESTMSQASTSALTTTVGAGSLGLTVDLVVDGPHLLITGTTGSGKSELLLTVLIGMIERYPPIEMSMILLDFKGGSSFNVLASLPHTMSVETNHVAASSFRSLDAIAAELYRREVLFANHQVADYHTFRRHYPDAVLPRLVVAIDELRVLVDDNPDAAATLARLAATGRSLGFHLIIATQRTQGAVNADIRANIGSVIALRTATEHDSWDVLSTGEAFRISSATPGRAYFKAGAEQPRLFQTSRYLLDDEPVVVLPNDQHVSDQLQLTTDWSGLVNELRRRAAVHPVADPVILPPLPGEVSSNALQTRYQLASQYAVVGLVDDPKNCRQYPVVLGTASANPGLTVLTESVAWIGASGSGIAAASEVVCRYVSNLSANTVFLDGGELAGDANGWDYYLHVSDAGPDVLQRLTRWIDNLVSEQQTTNVVITDWGSWVTQMVTGSFQGFEDILIHLLRQYSSSLTVYVFGARELAGGRMIAMIPDRFYLPMNSSPEHRMIWPKLLAVPSLPSRGVFVTAEHPTGGLAVQLVKR